MNRSRRVRKARRSESVEPPTPVGVIRFEVENVSSLDLHGSDSLEIWDDALGVPWSASVCKIKKDDGEEYVAAYLCGMENRSRMWSIEADIHFILIHPDSSKNKVVELEVALFDHESFNCGARLLKWNDFIDVENGFIHDDKITIEIQFWIVEMNGFRLLPFIDFTYRNKHNHDVALMLEGEKIYVGKQILALHSLFFNSMFYGNFAEKNKKEIELKDVDSEKFVELLHFIYPSHKKITDLNAEFILELADRFQMKKIIDQVEQFLINSSELDILAKLNISNEYRLAKLQDHCNGKSNITEDVTDNQWSVDFLDPNEPRHDVEIEFSEGEKVYVSKQYICLYSTWFTWELRSTDKIKVDVDREEFLEMLRVIYPSYGKITDENVNFLLKLAQRFDIKLLFDLAEDHLISSPVPSPASKLLLSERNILIKLQEHIFSSFEDWEDVRDIKESPEYRRLSDKTARTLLETVFPLLE